MFANHKMIEAKACFDASDVNALFGRLMMMLSPTLSFSIHEEKPKLTTSSKQWV